MITVTGFPSLPDIQCPSDGEGASAADLLAQIVQPLANRDAYRGYIAGIQNTTLGTHTTQIASLNNQIAGMTGDTLSVPLGDGRSQGYWDCLVSGVGIIYQEQIDNPAVLYFELNNILPRLCRITGIGISAIISSGHTGIPELLPRIRLYGYDGTGNTINTRIYEGPLQIMPTPANVAAYNGSFQIVNQVLETPVVRQEWDDTAYGIEIFGEDGANAIVGMIIRSVRVTVEPIPA